MSQMSVRMNSEEAYSHPICAIHYSAPERKAGRAERRGRGRGGDHTGKKNEGLRKRQTANQRQRVGFTDTPETTRLHKLNEYL